MQALTNELMRQLSRINREVNRDITYKTDSELYGKADFWTVIEGKGRGDCDDYTLTKIMRLVEETDWDRENLAIAVCYTETGEGHAVCVARTDHGDLVLDNRHKTVTPFNDLPYRWVMIEDYANKCWVKVLGE